MKKENNLVLQTFLDRYYFKPFKDPESNQFIELFIKGSCPSKCAYCYLQRHLKELYPLEYEKNDLILENLNSFLDFYIEQEFCCGLEIYSGRLFADDFGFEVLETIYQKFKDPFITKPQYIIIPDDMQFLLNDEMITKMEYYIDLFMNEIKIPFVISASVDGELMDQFRYGIRTEEFYNKVIKFCRKHDYGMHPMISAFGIKDWKENYAWWRHHYQDLFYKRVMFLEVRDNNWNGDKIYEYLNFLNFTFNIANQDVGYDKSELVKLIFNYDDYKIKTACAIANNGTEENPYKDRISCALQQTLHVRLGDLAIIPCHRLGYPQFVTGYFVKDENGKVCDIEEKNVSMFLACNSLYNRNLPKCHSCSCAELCMGPCFGSNYESTGDPFYTPDDLCYWFKAKTAFSLIKINKMGILAFLKDNDTPLFNKLTQSFPIVEEIKENNHVLYDFIDQLSEDMSC